MTVPVKIESFQPENIISDFKNEFKFKNISPNTHKISSLSQMITIEQLHSEILEYLTQRSRIMYCQKLHIWEEFTTLNNYQYSDYSGEELRYEFLQTILPKVFTYNLTAIQRRKIEIFAAHNGFTSTENGFKELPQTANLPTEGIHFSTSKEEAQEHNLSCVIGELTETPTPDKKIKAWVSVVNSTDEEIAFNRLLSKDELRSRMSHWQNAHKTTGKFPPNLTATIATKFIANTNGTQQLSSHVVPILNKNYT